MAYIWVFEFLSDSKLYSNTSVFFFSLPGCTNHDTLIALSLSVNFVDIDINKTSLFYGLFNECHG